MAFPATLRPLRIVPGLRDDAGLGCAPIGNLFAPVPDADAVATVEAALSAGGQYEVNFDVTANGQTYRCQ